MMYFKQGRQESLAIWSTILPKTSEDMPIPESATRLHSIDLVKYEIDTRKSILRLELLLNLRTGWDLIGCVRYLNSYQVLFIPWNITISDTAWEVATHL